VAVCRREDIPAGRGWPVRVGERYLAVFDLGDTVVAVDNECKHVGNPLDDGQVSGGCVTCPWHGWRYDLRTGDLLTMFGRRPGLRTYPARVEAGEILVEVAD
jgi:nitrite reductase/ring-hydroxylating ferredoxin subunit